MVVVREIDLCAERESFTGSDGGIHLVRAITTWYDGLEGTFVVEWVPEVVGQMSNVEIVKWSSNLGRYTPFRCPGGAPPRWSDRSPMKGGM